MDQYDVAYGRIHLLYSKQLPEGFLVGPDLFFQDPGNLFRESIGNHPDSHRTAAVRILQYSMHQFFLHGTGNMHLFLCEQAAGKGKLSSTVMVAGNHEYRNAFLREGAEKKIQQFHRFLPGRRSVVDISGNQYRIRSLFPADAEELLNPVILIVDHGYAVNGFAEMQIGCVEQFHFLLLSILTEEATA